MDKRNAKLQQLLQMLKLRWQAGELPRRCTIEKEGRTEEYLPDAARPGVFVSGRGTELVLEDVAEALEKQLQNIKHAVVSFFERGTVVRLQVLPGDVKLSFNTQDAPVEHRQPQYGTRQQFIRVEEARELLQALGLVTAEGDVRADRRRKFYQVDRFVELIDEMVESWDAERPLTVLDCGCGKSYLSFVLNYWLKERRRIPCRIVGIDDNPQVVKSSREIQKQLGYANMEFVASPILDYRPTGPVDMVLSLHACDTATDQALALGIYLGSKYIVAVPCCQAELRQRLDFGHWQSLARHNIFRNKLSDTITDGLRAAALEARGYRVSVTEYVSPLDTPKNIMLRATSTKNRGKQESYKDLQQHVRGVLPLEEYLDILAQRQP